MSIWVWPMQVWAKRRLLSPKDKKPWPRIPLPKIHWRGPAQEENMANIYALLGDADHAIPILKRLLQIPYGGGRIPCAGAITPALLRIRSEERRVGKECRTRGSPDP